MTSSATALLKQYGIHPQKGLGQSFLVNTGVLEKIVRAVAPAPDEPLLEIGPGIGVLTRMLAKAGARMTVVEMDRRMVKVLEAELGAHPRVGIVHGDILEVDLENLVRSSRFEVQQHRTSNMEYRTDRWRVVGNISYNISSPILFLLRDHRHLFREAILMIQREVAARLTARVGTKDYGLLTLGLGVVGTCERLFDVEPGSFWPAPKVVSSVVRIGFLDPPPFPDCDLATFGRVTRTAFGKRRKTIRNALVTAASAGQYGLGRTPHQIDAALATVGIAPTCRPETVTVEEFVRLTHVL